MLTRTLAQELALSANEMPVVTLTGPRQSGKSTLVKNCFPDYQYISMENPDVFAEFNDDPRFFLERYSQHVIFDEAQRTPQLFSYLQGIVDQRGTNGQFILTGSQNFLLMKTISQTLAGRVAVRYLLPLAYSEIDHTQAATPIAQWLFKGGYPRLYAGKIRTSRFYKDYFSTCVERDMRTELGLRKIADFDRFVRRCASLTGETFNAANFSQECGISRQTANEWMSILEASFIAFRLLPYYKNYGKQIAKTPKLYFYDTGLACNLMGMESAEQLHSSPMRGNIFENAVVAEIVKQYYMRGDTPRLFYWRDNKGLEIDFIIEKGGEPQYVIEAKASTTYDVHAWKNIDKIADQMGVDAEHRIVVYGGDEAFETRHGRVIGLPQLGELV